MSPSRLAPILAVAEEMLARRAREAQAASGVTVGTQLALGHPADRIPAVAREDGHDRPVALTLSQRDRAWKVTAYTKLALGKRR
jgi:hypothetical protein